jgi:hypothetical protein
MSALQERSYFIQRKGRSHGPCSLDEITSYLTYGSLQPEDLVWDQLADEWLPAQAVVNPSSGGEPQEGTGGWKGLLELAKSKWAPQESSSPQPKRRAVRYRDYFRVPESQRTAVVIKKLILGTLIFPFYTPSLWAAAATLFTKRVFRDRKNDEGYLVELHRGFETAGAILIVVNAVAWVISIHWLATVAWPMGVQLYDAVHGAFLEHFRTL